MNRLLVSAVIGLGLHLLLPDARARAQDEGTAAALAGADFKLTLARADDKVLDADALQAYFGRARCSCPTNVTATLAVAENGRDKLGTATIDATLMVGSDCSSVAATGCTSVGGTLTLSASKLSTATTIDTGSVFDAVNAGTDCATLPTRATRLWAILRLDGNRLTGPPSLALQVGGAAPAPPTATTVETADGGLLVSWKAAATAADLAGYQVLCAPGPASAPAAAFETCAAAPPASGDGPFATLDAASVCSTLVTSGTSVRVHGLENGRPYDVAVVAIGKDGTPSAPSAVAQGIPGPTLGFGDIYQAGGGMAQAGCAVGGGPPRLGGCAGRVVPLLALVVLVVLLGRRRRRTSGSFLCPIAAALTLAAAPARAQGIDLAATPVAHDGWRATASPRRWNLELRFGPYRPAIDDEFAERGVQARPFEQTFSSARRLMVQLEIDRHVSHRGGTLAVGAGVGYYRASARALAADLQTRTGDETALRLIPLSASLVFRADRLHETAGFPLIPYAKAGFDCALWSISDTSRASAMSGYTLGWHAATGVAMMLDFLDPESARPLDQESGINGAALFFEAAHYALDGLGSRPSLRVGDTTWLAGLMFEM